MIFTQPKSGLVILNEAIYLANVQAQELSLATLCIRCIATLIWSVQISTWHSTIYHDTSMQQNQSERVTSAHTRPAYDASLLECRVNKSSNKHPHVKGYNADGGQAKLWESVWQCVVIRAFQVNVNFGTSWHLHIDLWFVYMSWHEYRIYLLGMYQTSAYQEFGFAEGDWPLKINPRPSNLSDCLNLRAWSNVTLGRHSHATAT